MRLSASDLACRRGGREVFAGVSFAGRGRRGPGHSRPQRRGKIVPAAHDRRPGARRRGRLDLEGGDPELTIGEQAHYLGHQDALKPSLSVGENLALLVRVSRRPRRGRRNRLRGRARGARRPARRLSVGRPAAPPFDRPAARRKRPVWLLDEPTSTLDATAQEQLGGIMRAHLPAAASSSRRPMAPLGLDGAPASCRSARRRQGSERA